MAIVKLKTGSGEEITIDDSKKLGKGGEGSVYAVQSPAKYSRYCIKEYSAAILQDSKKMAERQAKVEYMAKNKVESSNPGIVICWPVEAIFRSGRFVGFMMLKAFDQSKELEWFVSYNLMKVIKSTPFCSFDGSNGMTALYNRLVVANNLAHALHTIHSTNHYVLADTKPKNILITSTGNVSIVDLDSLQIVVNDQLKFKAPVASPNYKPPEGYDGRLNQEFDIIPISWDRFSYAVMAYELIIGSHPYGVGSYKSPYDQGEDTMYKIRTGLFLHGSKSPYLRTEHEASLTMIRVRWNGLPEPLRQLFMAAFEKGQFKPEKRPTMQDWGKVLSDSITGLQSVLQKKPSAASSAIAAAGRSSASTLIAGALQIELVMAKQGQMTTPTHTTIPRQPTLPPPVRPLGPVTLPTIPPTKQGLSSSDKAIFICVAIVCLILWAASYMPDNSKYQQQSVPSTGSTQPYQQIEQQDTSINNAVIEQSSDQAASDETISQSEDQTASDVTASEREAQIGDTIYPTSFDCAKAKSISENLICHNSELAASDREMAGIFNQAKAAATDTEAFTKRVRKQWNYREKNCFDNACLTAWYAYMKDVLSQIAQTGNADIVGASSSQQPKPIAQPALSTAAQPTPTPTAQPNMDGYNSDGWRFDANRMKWVSALDDGRTDIAVKYRDGRVAEFLKN